MEEVVELEKQLEKVEDVETVEDLLEKDEAITVQLSGLKGQELACQKMMLKIWKYFEDEELTYEDLWNEKEIVKREIKQALLVEELEDAQATGGMFFRSMQYAVKILKHGYKGAVEDFLDETGESDRLKLWNPRID